MEENKNTEKLYDLIARTSFHMLSDDERSFVLSEVTEEEYKSMYDLHRHISGPTKEEPVYPSGAVKDRLLAAYGAKYETAQQTKKRGSILLMSVPLYQVAACIVLAIMMTSIVFYWCGSAAKTAPRIVYQVKRDTVFVARTEEKKGISTARIAMDSLSASQYSNTAKTGTPQHTTSMKESNADDCHLCHSIKKDNDLKQFMVSSI